MYLEVVGEFELFVISRGARNILFLQCIPSADLPQSLVKDEGRTEDHDGNLDDVHVNDGGETSTFSYEKSVRIGMEQIFCK